MAFPQSQLPVRVRIAPGSSPTASPATWTWTDITNDVRVAAGIDITVGRQDEGKASDASKCTLTVNNKGGHYSPRNPAGRWYGSLAKNTPLDVAISRNIVDSLQRTVAAGWGSTPDGDTWTDLWTDGTSSSSATAAGAIHQLSTPNNYRLSYLPNANASDVDMYVTASVNQVAAGGSIEIANLILRVTDSTTYYLFRVNILSNNTVGATIYDRSGQIVAGGSLAGYTYTANAQLRVRAQAIGQSLRLKVWPANQAEPAAWTIDTWDTGYVGGGGIGIRSGIATGNTSPKPITYTYTNMSASVWCTRFTGSVAAWPPRWDKSGNDKYVPIEAAGIIRRLQQGAAPLRSVLFRKGVSLLPAPVAYWSLEEAATSQTFAEALGRTPMTWTGGAPTRGTDAAPGSAPLVQLAADTALIGSVAPYDSSGGAWSVQVVVKLPDEQGQDVPILDVYTSGGTYRMWRLWFRYGAGPGISVQAYDYLGAATADLFTTNLAGTFADNKFGGHWMIIAFGVTQTGSNLSLTGYESSPDDTALSSYGVGVYRNFGSTTVTNATAGAVTQVGVPFSTGYPHNNWLLGHVMVLPTQASVFSRELLGYTQEAALDRISRLCQEEGVQFVSYYGGTSTQMGPQTVNTFLELLRESETTDGGGILHEVGGGFGYLPRSRRYNRPVTMALDFAQGHVAEPPEPADDDQQLRNDVTCSRPSGSSARFIDKTSVNSVTKVGTYADTVTVNTYADADLLQEAAWRVHLGTVDEMRWPALTIDLASRPALIPQWLGCMQGSRITAANPPAEVAPFPIDQVLEGWTEKLGPFDWSATMNLTPFSSWRAFVLGDSDLGRLDHPDATVRTTTAAGATTLPVQSASGTLWTTDPTHYPMTLNVGGYKVTASACSGSSSPQTFTVSALPAQITAGATVRVWRPGVLAL